MSEDVASAVWNECDSGGVYKGDVGTIEKKPIVDWANGERLNCV